MLLLKWHQSITYQRLGTPLGKLGPMTSSELRVQNLGWVYHKLHFNTSLPFYESIKWNKQVAASIYCQSPTWRAKTSEQRRFTCNVIHRYLHNGHYPDGYTKSARQGYVQSAREFTTQVELNDMQPVFFDHLLYLY